MVTVKQDIRDWKWPYPDTEHRPVAAASNAS
jgi:hypothetical protein